MRVLTDQQINEVLTAKMAVEAIEKVFQQEAQGKTVLPTRLNFNVNHGWFRTMPGAIMTDDHNGVMGCKIMNLHKERGLHYIIHLYDQATGAPLAMMDAAAITAIRTGAVSAVAVKKMVPHDTNELGLIGTGYEARGQLTAMAAVLPLKKVKVFSRNEQNRKQFAEEMSAELGIEVVPAASGEEAVADQSLVVLATKSSVPVIDGDWVARNSKVVSISVLNRELDMKTIARAGLILVDHKEQVMTEAADIKIAMSEGIVEEGQFLEIYNYDGSFTPGAEKDILLFKSTGTALQDLAVAYEVYQACLEKGLGQTIDDFPYLKTFK